MDALDALDLLARLMAAVALLMALAGWGLAFTGRHNPKMRSPEAQAKDDRLQPLVIGLLGLTALIELALPDSQFLGGSFLAVFALMGWTRDRVRLREARTGTASAALHNEG